jgi:hypothetical protein
MRIGGEGGSADGGNHCRGCGGGDVGGGLREVRERGIDEGAGAGQLSLTERIIAAGASVRVSSERVRGGPSGRARS